MSNFNKNKMKYFICLFAFKLLFFSFGCNSNPVDSETEKKYEMFLTKNIKNNFPENVSLYNLSLEDEPILSTQLIESYTWKNHMISFSDETRERIKLKEPLFERYFVVTAQNQRIYWGLFTDIASSGICQNPVILLLPRHPDKSNFIPNSFVIERAYPNYFGDVNDKDLRNNIRIYNELNRVNYSVISGQCVNLRTGI